MVRPACSPRAAPVGGLTGPGTLIDLLLVPCQAEVVQGSVPLQRRLGRELLFLQPEGERALQGRSSAAFVRAQTVGSGIRIEGWMEG